MPPPCCPPTVRCPVSVLPRFPPQATHSGFGFISQENVFKVCDQPHPLLVARIMESCAKGDLDAAHAGMKVCVPVLLNGHVRLQAFGAVQ